MEEKHIADYFIISGVSENPEFNTESKQLISSVLPITDITVIFRGLGEQCPNGYTCIETTPGGHLADLNNGNFKSPNIQICYRRGNDKPPLVDVGVYHEDKERVLPDVEVVYTTPYGRCASTGNNGSKSGTFITYRRAKTNSPFNQLVVVDLCVILNNKSEHPPHAFYSIKKNLNKSYYGMIGSEVFICYKKTLFSPPSLCYTPQIVSRFPLQDYANFPLPDTVPLFCLPTGANIELWPANIQIPKPVASTFVLTSDSAQKIYGSALSFYEPFDESRLTQDQKTRLGISSEGKDNREIYAIKSICILSRWPFFECFEKFLTFLHRLVFNPKYSLADPDSPTHKSNVSLEHYISHFLLDVSFPTPQRPTVLVQLMPGTDETVSISQPSSRLPLPLTGASFIQLLSILGVDNTMNVLLFGLSEQKILLHSLRPWVLTGVAEALTAMLFPFHWQCPYVPLCPLSLHGILNAPLPFIVGIDSRCFDTFTPPDDIICIDLDTKSIFLSELKKCLNLRILPKRAARVLRSSLEKIFQKTLRILQALGNNQSPQRSPSMEASRRQIEKKLELEIQEAFVRFMATILRGFRSYLLPITRAPTIGATDPTSLFDFEGFLMSRDRNYNQFYQLITKSQMFTHYIEERSFVSDKDTSLAFFDDCEEKLISSDDIFSDRPIKLFDKDDGLIQTDRSVYIPAPEQSPSISSNSISSTQQAKSRSVRFGPLNSALFHRHPQVSVFPSLDRALNDSTRIDSKLLFDSHTNEFNSSFSISRRTKQEVKASQKLAKKSAETPLDWSKYLVSCCYCLWFSSLPAYISYCKSANQLDFENIETSSKTTSRILRYAYSTIVRMQKLGLTTDEICFRVLTLLCGHYGQPALAVRVFFEMKKAGIKPNAVTYGYYNKAVLESKWPDHSSKPTTVLWTKIRNVVSGIALFKLHGRMRMNRRTMRFIPLVGDAAFSRPDIDVVDRASHYNIVGDFFHPMTLPIEHDRRNSSYNALNQHRSSVNRSFSTYSKTNHNSTEANHAVQESESQPQHKNHIHKSYSMHLRDGSPDRSLLVKTKSSSLEDEEEPPIIPKSVAPVEASAKKTTLTLDCYLNTRERHKLLNLDSDSVIIKNIDLIDNSAGILFTTSPKSFRAILNNLSPSLIDFGEKEADLSCVNNQTPNNFLRNSNLTTKDHHITDAIEFLKSSSFGEDARILKRLESRDQKPDFSSSVDCLGETSEVNSNRLSESTIDPSESLAGQDDDYDLKNITSTPNFKLSSLINEASNLQWSKWTSSQNSKSVYKGIKSAATGIVSSLQEIKSSFSISNSNTPSKLLTSAHHRSTATREMLSQWANYFSSQPSRGDADSDNSSVGSNDLLRMSNDEDAEPSTAEASDFYRLFEDLERYYGNSNSKEDLIDHLSDLDGTKRDQVAIEIQMTTCSRCNVCRSLLYDEEIMERWSHNESNLNTRCVYCRAKIVPLMSILVEDRRFDNKLITKQSPVPEETSQASNNLVDLDYDNANSMASNHKIKGSSETIRSKRDSQSVDNDNQQSFTVPYLSPIVLRKELESVFESSGDICPASSRFVDEHPIIFWNLLWYFSRINAPTHLALLCLKSKSILNEREIPKEWLDSQKVVVRTLWDNEKLHSEIGKPLYRLWERGDPSLKVQAILCDNLYFTYSSLDRVINFLEVNELGKAMNLVLNARLKSSTKFSFDKNRHNLYRDLIFLAIKALGPAKLSKGKLEFRIITSHHVKDCY